MGNKIYNTKLFRFMEHKMALRIKCYDCKAWHKKVCTFRGKNGKRYCASCAPADTFEQHIQYGSPSNDYTTLLP